MRYETEIDNKSKKNSRFYQPTDTFFYFAICKQKVEIILKRYFIK